MLFPEFFEAFDRLEVLDRFEVLDRKDVFDFMLLLLFVPLDIGDALPNIIFDFLVFTVSKIYILYKNDEKKHTFVLVTTLEL